MTAKKSFFSLAILVSFCLMFAVSCGNTNNGSNAQVPSGALPILKVGDTWTWRDSLNDTEYIRVDTVTGEKVFNGINCYTGTSQYTFATGDRTFTAILAIDKTNLRAIGIEYSSSINGTAHTGAINKSYTYSVQPYPLSVGKTWIVTINTTAAPIENQTATEKYIYKVEKIETINVPAGTFQCFKIVAYSYYSDSNLALYTEWVTDVTRGAIVKSIITASGQTTELISYSLSK